MDPVVIEAVGTLVAPLLGAGAGTYFGLKTALNGMRESVRRIDGAVGQVRDDVRDVKRDFHEHAEQASRFIDEAQMGRLRALELELDRLRTKARR